MKNRSKFGWLELLSGLGMMTLGVLAIAAPDANLTYLYIAVAMITGIHDVVFYVKAGDYSGIRPIVSLVCGMLSIMVGAVLLAYPQSGMEVRYVMVFPIWYGGHCIFRLVNLKVQNHIAGKGSFRMSLVINVLGLIFVALMLLRPEVIPIPLHMISGVYLAVSGIDCIAMGLSKLGGKW